MANEGNKGLIVVINRKGESIKQFKTWHFQSDTARVEIKFRNKAGEKKKIVKEYEGWGGTVALLKCVEAVIKYWPKYDPSKHDMYMTSGHGNELKKKKKS